MRSERPINRLLGASAPAHQRAPIDAANRWPRRRRRRRVGHSLARSLAKSIESRRRRRPTQWSSRPVDHIGRAQVSCGADQIEPSSSRPTFSRRIECNKRFAVCANCFVLLSKSMRSIASAERRKFVRLRSRLVSSRLTKSSERDSHRPPKVLWRCTRAQLVVVV